MNDVERRSIYIPRDSRDDEVKLQQEATSFPIINGDLEGTIRTRGWSPEKRRKGQERE